MKQRFLLDTSAWIEYFLGTSKGEKVRALISTEDSIILLPNVVAAEVASKVIRMGLDADKAIKLIQPSISPIEDREFFFEAGKLQVTLRQKYGHASLVDAIIMVLADKNDARIITFDHHLAGTNTILLKE